MARKEKIGEKMNIKRRERKLSLGLNKKHNPSSIKECWVKNLGFRNARASSAIP